MSSPSWAVQAAMSAITWSDQFKPGHLASMRGIRFVNVTPEAVMFKPVAKTGSWRFYNFLGAWVKPHGPACLLCVE